MKKTILLWIAAFIITAGAAVYQRITGPSYPIKGEIKIGTEKISFSLPRSNSSRSELPVSITTGKLALSGKVCWKRYKTNDKYTAALMIKDAGELKGFIPKQPPAGKVQYTVVLTDVNGYEYFLTDDPVIARFRGDVPALILVPHIIIMFAAMLLSTRTGLELFNKGHNLKLLTIWTIILLFIGGLILGPLTQLYAFGALWTGFPYGTDLTDNKTLIAFLGWAAAAVAVYKFRNPARWAFAASIILLLVYLIPHSMFGSELDYSAQPQKNMKENIINK